MEGELPANHGVEDNPSGPDIDLFIIALLVEHFRGDIGWGPTGIEHVLIGHDDLAESEISQFNLQYLMCIRVLFYQYILGFQVSVDNPAEV